MPELQNVVLFYDNGLVFQTTFDQSVSIPEIGENLARLISDGKDLLKSFKGSQSNFQKVIYEIEDLSIMILRLGEQSNIALFIDKKKLAECESGSLNSSNINALLEELKQIMDTPVESTHSHDVSDST